MRTQPLKQALADGGFDVIFGGTRIPAVQLDRAGRAALRATGLAEVILETLASGQSERSGRLGDSDDGGSLEQKKREGYF